jgi:hypothetical protein
MWGRSDMLFTNHYSIPNRELLICLMMQRQVQQLYRIFSPFLVTTRMMLTTSQTIHTVISPSAQFSKRQFKCNNNTPPAKEVNMPHTTHMQTPPRPIVHAKATTHSTSDSQRLRNSSD